MVAAGSEVCANTEAAQSQQAATRRAFGTIARKLIASPPTSRSSEPLEPSATSTIVEWQWEIGRCVC